MTTRSFPSSRCTTPTAGGATGSSSAATSPATTAARVPTSRPTTWERASISNSPSDRSATGRTAGGRSPRVSRAPSASSSSTTPGSVACACAPAASCRPTCCRRRTSCSTAMRGGNCRASVSSICRLSSTAFVPPVTTCAATTMRWPSSPSCAIATSASRPLPPPIRWAATAPSSVPCSRSASTPISAREHSSRHVPGGC
ncbi:MAG: hypothetical protein AW12_02931 [Candidatus Accumulibacter sp. BA-94]|nr:MAG: hypothetical protein AW12_02931 [Candidatus Accumulibacter sp. BA-94]